VLGIQVLALPAFGQGDLSPKLFRGPYLQNTSSTSTDFLWVSRDLEGPGRVVLRAFGRDAGTFVETAELVCETVRPDVPTARCHRVRIEGLRPNSAFSYQLFVGDTPLTHDHDSEFVLSFRTPPSPGTGTVRFTTFGDSGMGTEAQDLVGQVAAGFEPDAILHTGDIDYLHDPDRSVFAPYREMLFSTPLFVARGNHDTEYPFGKFFTVPNPDPQRRTEREDMTYGGFDYGPAHVYIVDTTIGYLAGEPGERLVKHMREDLADARDRGMPWIICVMHAPIFTVGPHAIDDELITIRNMLTPVLEEFDVDLVICGDDHLYHRSHPIRTGTDLCPQFAPNPCDPEPDVPFCYETLEVGKGPDYADPDGTVYVVSGGGGQILYGGIQSTECRFVDQKITAELQAKFHALDILVSPAMIRVRAVDLIGKEFDRFSIQKVRGLPGDLNQDGILQLNDALVNLLNLFGQFPLDCPPIGDVDASGKRDIGDAIYLLNFLFLGGSQPAAPFPDCGQIESATPGFCKDSTRCI